MNSQPPPAETSFETRIRLALTRVVRAQAATNRELKGAHRELAAHKA